MEVKLGTIIGKYFQFKVKGCGKYWKDSICYVSQSKYDNEYVHVQQVRNVHDPETLLTMSCTKEHMLEMEVLIEDKYPEYYL